MIDFEDFFLEAGPTKRYEPIGKPPSKKPKTTKKPALRLRLKAKPKASAATKALKTPKTIIGHAVALDKAGKMPKRRLPTRAGGSGFAGNVKKVAAKFGANARMAEAVKAGAGLRRARPLLVQAKGALHAAKAGSIGLRASLPTRKLKRLKTAVKRLQAKAKVPRTSLKLKRPSKSSTLKAAIGGNVLLGAVKKIAEKTPLKKKEPTAKTAKKARAAAKPIAHACGCTPDPIIRHIDAQMACAGYPVGSAKHILASIHDMNTALEKAAVQRLATFEHKKLSAQQAFERDVLERLTNLAVRLPPCHPTRTRAHLNILRRV